MNALYKVMLLSVICSLLLFNCTSSDQNLQKLEKEIYLQKQWTPPLPPNKFKSDGCSFCPDNEWLKCCVEHDVIYWMGGSKEERKQADLDLEKCVGRSGHPFIGKIMYYSVRIGGVYWLPAPFRWGFGWDYPQSGPPG